jgi:uncharacterized protein (TIGR02996 family)
MNDADSFFEEILARPEEDGPRLMYADWLQERGDPRGEFIHLQCRWERERRAGSRLTHEEDNEDQFADESPLESLKDRIQELLHRHEAEWVAPLNGLAQQWVFQRGFIEYIACRFEDFSKRHAELFAVTPLNSVTLVERGAAFLTHREPARPYKARYDGVEALAGSPVIGRLRGLCLDRCLLDEKDISILAGSPHLSGLKRLSLARNDLADEGTTALAASTSMNSLEVLDLSWNDVTNHGIEALAASPLTENLGSLVLMGNQIRVTGARALARSKGLRRLTHLDIRANRMEQRAVSILMDRFGSAVLA